MVTGKNARRDHGPVWRIFWLGDRWIGDDDDNDSVRSAILFLKSGTAGGGVEKRRTRKICSVFWVRQHDWNK